MGFVEDDGGGFGEYACIGGVACLLFDIQVSEEEVMVDDDKFGLSIALRRIWP